MATVGTPYQGLDYAAARVYGSHLSLVCYSNGNNTLSDSTVYGDLTQPTVANGYAPVLLDGTWTFSNGLVTYLKSGANPYWLATGTWSAVVNGVAIVDVANSKILHFKDLAVQFTASNLRRLEIDITTLVA